MQKNKVVRTRDPSSAKMSPLSTQNEAKSLL